MRISLHLNGVPHAGDAEPRTSLADFIRERGLTGTKVGCEQGACGACTVQVDGEPVRACLMLAVQADGTSVRTVEGLAAGGEELHPLQRTFHEEHALQCGFCTAGILMTLDAFLRDTPDPTGEQIREALSGNLCRCTGYEGMVRAVAKSRRPNV
ncbi:(2Fe-2S)-binding protein [Candidatus Solirubrobacter pratensis]|uniref:(2Fe-2S)-binding protein n=1 Tax=Candidatus Solirubrobacter pratensis TaxID=1298857 RepID=UPI0004274A3F|nr:(2Fe-2S)-binding protein [Candidatus Solirubrobacter pratensis]